MPLDFITLYVIVLINSASFALVWAVIALTYRSLTAARHWLAALLMTCASGPLLFLGVGHPVLAFFGLTLVAGSFAMIWQGLRVFYGNSFQGWHVLAIMAATMLPLRTRTPPDSARALRTWTPCLRISSRLKPARSIALASCSAGTSAESPTVIGVTVSSASATPLSVDAQAARKSGKRRMTNAFVIGDVTFFCKGRIMGVPPSGRGQPRVPCDSFFRRWF